MNKAIAKYFNQDDKANKVYVLADKIDVYIPKRYEVYGGIDISDKISMLAIFDMVINDKINAGYLLPANITTCPSEVEAITKDNNQFYQFTYRKGDVFMDNLNVVQNPSIAYTIFVEFLSLGNMPKFMTYEKASTWFDNVAAITGSNLSNDHVIFEFLAAHCYRDAKNIAIPYRLTNRKQPPVYIPLRSVAYAATSMTGRISGSWLAESMNAGMIHKAESQSNIEELFRK